MYSTRLFYVRLDARIGPADSPDGNWELVRWCQVS